jgi:hypothetical protein
VNGGPKFYGFLEPRDPNLVRDIYKSRENSRVSIRQRRQLPRSKMVLGTCRTPSPSKIQLLIVQEEVASMLLSIRGKLRRGL